MGEFFMSMVTLLGGVGGAAIGFILLAGVIAFLLLPYMLMSRPPRPTREEEAMASDRYS